MDGIYLDNNTVTRPSLKAVEAMLPFLKEKWGVPTSPHAVGQSLLPELRRCYEAIYALLGASVEDGFVFTSSGAEAINHVFTSVQRDVTQESGKNHFLTAATDEAPSILAAGRLEQTGCVSKMVAVNGEGVVTVDAVADALTPRTALLSLSWANGLTGVVQPVAEIAELCRDRGVLLHLDASYILGKLFFELEDIMPDFVTFRGEVLHAPQGCGGLYFPKKHRPTAFVVGGADQAGLRAGAMNVAGLAALAVAAREATASLNLMCTEVARLRDKFENRLKERVGDINVFFGDSERLPNTTALAFRGVTSDALLYALSQRGVYASFGGGSFQQLRLVLECSGVDSERAQSALSFSLSRETTDNDIDEAVNIISDVVDGLRSLSESMCGDYVAS